MSGKEEKNEEGEGEIIIRAPGAETDDNGRGSRCQRLSIMAEVTMPEIVEGGGNIKVRALAAETGRDSRGNRARDCRGVAEEAMPEVVGLWNKE